MIHQSKLPVRWQLLLLLQHLPPPCNSGCKVAGVETAEEVAEVVEAAEEAVEEVAEEAEEEAEEVHLVDSLLPHLQPQRQARPITEED